VQTLLSCPARAAQRHEPKESLQEPAMNHFKKTLTAATLFASLSMGCGVGSEIGDTSAATDATSDETAVLSEALVPQDLASRGIQILVDHPTLPEGLAPETVKSDARLGCFIKTVCRSLPWLPPEFRDEYQGASLSAQRCSQRAREYSDWCGNILAAEESIAEFRVPGLSSKVVARPANDSSCIVALKACPRFPPYAGAQFGDIFDGSDVNPARCHLRAAEYHSWCGLAPADRVNSVTASFLKAGQAPRPFTFPAP
jgi:hypothetical protein